MSITGTVYSYDVEKCKKELSRSLYRLILNTINQEQLKPAIKIDILRLSQKIGLKETPVIDALNFLSDYGLLEKNADQNEFYTISKYSEDIIQTYYTRSILESNAAFLCARQLNCPNKERICELAQIFLKSNDVNIMKEADFEFHCLIIKSCGNEYIMQFYNSLAEKIKYYMMSNVEHVFQSRRGLSFSPNHVKIANAIILNEPALAEKEMKDHIDEAFIDAIFYSIKTNSRNRKMDCNDT